MHGPVKQKTDILDNPEKIIIRMPNWIGDLVMATPLLTDLRRAYPGAELTALCQSNVAPLLKNDIDVDQILSFSKAEGWIHKPHADITKSLKYGDYDIGILTTNSFSSAWWFWCGGVKIRIGFTGNWRSKLLNFPIKRPPMQEQEHQVITYKRLLVPLGIPISDTKPRLYQSESDIVRVQEMLAKWGFDSRKNTLIGINPGAAYGSAKCWLPERFKELTKRLADDPNTYILYFGDALTAKLIANICQGMPQNVINLAGKTSLNELIALISLCSCFLSNDSGPMHIAAALNVPLVALFGSTNEVKTGPYNPLSTVIHKHVACSPCYKRTCPIDFRCMTSIQVDEVLDKIQKSLHGNRL